MAAVEAQPEVPPEEPPAAPPEALPAALPAELPDELWALMFAIDDDVAARCFSLNRLLHILAKHWLISRNVLPPRVRRLKERDTCVQSDLCEALVLPPKTVRPKLFHVKRRRGGGHYNIFLASRAVDALVEENGGLLGLRKRIVARRTRAANKVKKRKEDESKRAVIRAQLEKGMAVLELPLGYVYDTPYGGWGANPSFGFQLHFFAHSYYLDKYAGSEYHEDVENTIEEKRERFYPDWCAYPYKDLDELDEYAKWEVRNDPSHALPKKLPWLGDKFKSTQEAIRAAVAAASSCEQVAKRPEQVAKRPEKVAKPQQREASSVRKKREADAAKDRVGCMIANLSANAALYAAEAAVDASGANDNLKAPLLRFAMEIVKTAATGATAALMDKLDKLPNSAFKALDE